MILDLFLNGLRIRVCVSCLPTSPCLMLLYTPSFAYSAPELAPQDLADSCTRSFYLPTPTLVDARALSSERAATRTQCRQQTVLALRPLAAVHALAPTQQQGLASIVFSLH